VPLLYLRVPRRLFSLASRLSYPILHFHPGTVDQNFIKLLITLNDCLIPPLRLSIVT
jgi:hypothetical protein